MSSRYRGEESMNNAKCSLLWGNGLAKCSRTAQRYMSKIPSIQAADIMRDPRLNKVCCMIYSLEFVYFKEFLNQKINLSIS